MRIDQFFAARYFRKFKRCLYGACKTAYMRNHHCRLERSFFRHAKRFSHVAYIAARRPDNMRCIIMDVIKIYVGAKIFVGRACEKIQTTVASQNGGTERQYGSHGGKTKHIVEAFRRIAFKLPCWIRAAVCIDYFDLHTEFFHFCFGENFLCARYAFFIDIGKHNERRPSVAVDGIHQCAESHGACRSKQRELSAFFDSHFVGVYSHLRMKARVKSAYTARHRFRKRRFKICVAVIFEQAVKLHDFVRQNTVRRIAPAKFIGISRRPHFTLIVERRLNRKLHTGLKAGCIL